MAQLISFTTSQGQGFKIKNLPMPDGSYKTYKLIGHGKETICKILKKWEFDCNKMLDAIVWN